MLKFRIKSCLWALVLGLTFGCSAAQTDSGNLQVGSNNVANSEVDNVVSNAVGEEYSAGSNQQVDDNGQLLGMGGNSVGDNVSNVMNDSNLGLNTVSGNEVTNAVESAQAIDEISSGDEGNVLADGANVAEVEQPQDNNFYGDGQTQLADNLAAVPTDNQIDNPVNNSMDVNTGDDASVGGMEASDMSDSGMGDSGAGTMTASLPEMGAKMVYIVKRGDTLGDIAQNIYGDKSKWRDLASWSGFANPHLIFPGDVVYYQYTQESAGFAANYESQLRMEEVVVQAGDSLSKIAARVYGNPMAWIVLWRHNGEVANPDLIQIGMKIHYPTTSFLVADAQGVGQEQEELDAPVAQQIDQIDQADQEEGQVVSQAPDQVPAAG